MNQLQILLLVIEELPHILPMLKTLVNTIANMGGSAATRAENDLHQALAYYHINRDKLKLSQRLETLAHSLLTRAL